MNMAANENALRQTQPKGAASTSLRMGISVAFLVLGFVSLFAWAKIDVRLCASFPGICTHVGGCTEIDHCALSWWQWVDFLGFIFGPSILFAVAAFGFSKRVRTPLVWCAFAAALSFGHWSTMLLERIVVHL